MNDWLTVHVDLWQTSKWLKPRLHWVKAGIGSHHPDKNWVKESDWVSEFFWTFTNHDFFLLFFSVPKITEEGSIHCQGSAFKSTARTWTFLYTVFFIFIITMTEKCWWTVVCWLFLDGFLFFFFISTKQYFWENTDSTLNTHIYCQVCI